MRVLEAFGEPISYGGQESFVMNVLENMDRSGITADLLSPYYCDNKDIEEKIKRWGGELYALGCSFKPGKLRNSAAAPIRRFLKEHHYDVIHIHSGSNSMLAMMARLASEAGIPRIIVHSHCTGKAGLKHSASKAITAGALSRYPSAYCSCSREAGEWRFPRRICRSSLNIINNGIDVERFRYDENVRKEMRSRLGLDDDTVLVGCVGRLTYQKNQSFLLDVMREAADLEPDEDCRLILIGDGEDRSMLEGKTADLDIREKVIFTGAVSNVQDYLQALDVAVMPSRYEGLAIAVIEEQASGLEILVSEAIPESAAVTDGVVFLPAGDKHKWAQAIMRKHSRHPEQADQVAANGYSIKETASVVRRLYAE